MGESSNSFISYWTASHQPKQWKNRYARDLSATTLASFAKQHVFVLVISGTGSVSDRIWTWTAVGFRLVECDTQDYSWILLAIDCTFPRAEKNHTSAGLPGSSYAYTQMELKTTTVLFIVAVIICALVLFLCLLSVAVAICLVVYCVKLYKTSTALGEEEARKERGEGDSQKRKDDSKQDSGLQLRALREVTCSVESLTNGNFKQNPHYSKVEYQVGTNW